MSCIREAVIVSAVRTPIGKLMGALSALRPQDLGAIAIKECVARSGVDPELIDEVIMGQVVQAGMGQSPGRQAALLAGLPPSVNAFTINKVCGSGLKAVMLAAQAIKLGDADFVVAGGMESMTHCPHATNLRWGAKYGDVVLKDLMIFDGLTCPVGGVHMGELGEYTAEKSGITREQQDWLAAESHRKAVEAQEKGYFADEIVKVEIPQKKGDPIVVDKDEGPRPDTTIESLAKLKPAFKKDGTITPGNAPGLNDGAAAVLVTSEDKAKEMGLPVMAYIRAYASNFVEPKDLFYAPIGAVRKVMEKVGAKGPDYFDLIEVNEAFAAQVLADHKELQWDWERYNVHGGSIALGHPIGASGARILATLLYALKRYNKRIGLASLCLGTGGAVAMVVERT